MIHVIDLIKSCHQLLQGLIDALLLYHWLAQIQSFIWFYSFFFWKIRIEKKEKKRKIHLHHNFQLELLLNELWHCSQFYQLAFHLKLCRRPSLPTKKKKENYNIFFSYIFTLYYNYYKKRRINKKSRKYNKNEITCWISIFQ